MPSYASISAILQIAILYVAIYAILRRASGSRFGQMLMGVGVLIAILAVFTYFLDFDVLALIIQYLLAYFAISAVVIFQPEIRRMLSSFGTFGAFDASKSRRRGGAIDARHMTDILVQLAERKIGALFAFEHGISLRGYEETGVKLDAVISRELISSVFTPPLPLHDGGAVVRNGRLSSAHCIFPVSNNPDLAESGMRHRAAVGLSEETDALVVAVSEERGTISIAHNGRLFRYEAGSAAEPVRRWLGKALLGDSREGRLVRAAIDSLHRLLFRPIAISARKEKA